MAADLPEHGIRSYLYRRGPGHLHRGIDLGAPEGTPVYAVTPGIVKRAIREMTPGFRGYGKAVVIRGLDGTEQLYAHLASVDVGRGDWVKRGQRIGTVGRTKYTAADPGALFSSSAAHLHLEVSRGSYPMGSEAPRIDPVRWIKDRGVHPLTGTRPPEWPDETSWIAEMREINERPVGRGARPAALAAGALLIFGAPLLALLLRGGK